jgi:integrase
MTRKKSYQKGNVQLHNNVWTLRYREIDHRTGKWDTKRERLGIFKNKKAALQAAEPVMAQVNERNNSDKPPEAEHLTFRQFVESRWRAYSVTAKHQPSTIDCHSSLLKIHLLPRFGEMFLKDIKPMHISECLESLCRKSANTQLSIYSLLRQMFDLAQQYDLIQQSPVRPKLHRPEAARVSKPTLDPMQIRALLDNLGELERVYVLLVATTGIRVNEGLALRWTDFDETSRKMTIAHTLYHQRLKSPKTESSKRIIRLHPAICGMLVSHRQRAAFKDEEDFIFCRPNGEPLHDTTMRNRLYRAMKATGIPRVKGKHGYHIFRHTAASLLYAKSRDLKLVQGLLGHANLSTTSNTYVHLDGATVAEGTEILTEVILGDFLPSCDLTVTQVSEMVS